MYQKLLEFYNAAFRILTRKGAKIVLRVVLQDGRLSEIIQDFSRHAGLLRKLVQKATWEIVEDIKAMLYDRESMCFYKLGTSWSGLCANTGSQSQIG